MTPQEAQIMAAQQAAAAGAPPAPQPSILSLAGSLLGKKDKAPEYDNTPDWETVTRRELRFKQLPDGQVVPVLKVYDPSGGKTETLLGPEALAYAPTGRDTGFDEDIQKLRSVIGPRAKANDYRLSKRYRYAKKFGEWLSRPEESLIGKAFDSPVTGALTAGAAGFGVGKLGEWGEKWLTGRDEPSMPWSTIAMLLSGVLGGVWGQARKNVKDYQEKKGAVMWKSAMYSDPRNFILERLQGATDISPFEKAQLAARVRSMSTMEAETLKSLVRSAVGFGVGAIIARFFGMSIIGPGLAGAVAGAFWPSGNRPPSGIF